MEKSDNSAETSGDTLERLLEVEARLEARLEECEAEAARLVDEAREEAVRREQRLERELREEHERHVRERGARLAERVCAERHRAALKIRRLRAVPAEQVESLARRVIRQVLRETR